ncbi:MAG: glucose-6-phosphate isomerase family protein [Terrimicrobiaceae bacterium]
MSPLPCSVAFSVDTGIIAGATARYQKRLSDLRGLFLDSDSLERRIREEKDPVCYENFAFNNSLAEGDIFFGTTVVYPGKVGLEYHLTRGHYHRKRDRAETYQALSGRGLVLFEREDGATRAAELVPGKVTYIPPFWAHRSVNTGETPLVFLWTCPVDAGHDYASLGQRGMRLIVLERNGIPCVENRPHS